MSHVTGDAEVLAAGSGHRAAPVRGHQGGAGRGGGRGGGGPPPVPYPHRHPAGPVLRDVRRHAGDEMLTTTVGIK